MSILLFVYGTLKRGFSNHFLLEQDKFLGRHITEPLYKMISLGAFPAVLLGGSTSIQGEVYKVRSLELTDMLEGYPRFYTRVPVPTSYGMAWMYVLNSGVIDEFDEITELAGNWPW